MTHTKIQKPGIDIYTCPQSVITNATELSIGDLHANSMLMMYFLVANGVVKITEENYAKLKDIYLKEKLGKSDIATFNHIIDGLEINEKPLLRFIGDEICDRGQNDYFIFKILDKLHTSGVRTEIMLSNHGIEFMIPYEQKQELYAPNIDWNGQARSMNNMRALMENDILSKEEVEALVKRSYLPNLKLISYTLDGNNLTIYSHAGIGLETIRSLAQKFKADGVVYKDASAEELAQTIEAINAVFDKHVQAGTVNTLTIDITSPSDYRNDPVTFLIWNRKYHDLSREQEHNGYQMFYAHGHDSGEHTQKNIINLDNTLGKHVRANVGTYSVLGAQGGSLAQLQALNDQKELDRESLNSSIISDVQLSQMNKNNKKEIDLELVNESKLGSVILVDSINPFQSQLSKLKSKAEILLKDGHSEAYRSAINIHTDFINAYKQLQQDGNYQKFNKICTDVITKERPKLEKHRGWSEFLINLTLAISTAGIGLIVKGAINLSQNRSFFFARKTNSAKIVDEIQDKLNESVSLKI